jgi:hypothetical protein
MKAAYNPMVLMVLMICWAARVIEDRRTVAVDN